mmetsp:Transcript_26701/g.67101  ORF Transcript_26701/g.67101 Transcript_26701/m.67101 type:complete len:213 (+) Transcript_26701:135-773(+)
MRPQHGAARTQAVCSARRHTMLCGRSQTAARARPSADRVVRDLRAPPTHDHHHQYHQHHHDHRKRDASNHNAGNGAAAQAAVVPAGALHVQVERAPRDEHAAVVHVHLVVAVLGHHVRERVRAVVKVGLVGKRAVGALDEHVEVLAAHGGGVAKAVVCSNEEHSFLVCLRVVQVVAVCVGVRHKGVIRNDKGTEGAALDGARLGHARVLQHN